MATGGGGASGIELLVTFNLGETCHLERDTDSGFGSAVEIATLTGKTQSYVDPLPIDGTTYYYRAYVSKASYTDSSYSSSVSADPVVLES